MRKLSGYTSDDGEVSGTAAEVKAYEARQKLRNWVAFSVGDEHAIDQIIDALAAAPDEAIALVAALKVRKPRGKDNKPRRVKARPAGEAEAAANGGARA